MCSLSKDIEASQKQWLSKLHKARDSALQFDKGYNNFSQWISTVQQQLHTDEGIRATVGGVERQIQTVQVSHLELPLDSEIFFDIFTNYS